MSKAGCRVEIVVASHRHDMGARRQLDGDLRLWIDPDGRTGGESQAGARLHADLQIGPRFECRVDVGQHLERRPVSPHRLFGLRTLGMGWMLGIRECAFGRDRSASRRNLMGSENPDEVVPRRSLVHPDIDQSAVGIPCQGLVGVGIETVAVHRMAMNRPGGGGDEKDIAARFHDPRHLCEGQPEEFAVFQHLAREHQINGGIGKRKLVGVLEHDRDPGCILHVAGQIVEPRPIEDLPEAAVHVGAAHIEHDDLLLPLKRSAFDVTTITFVHVLKGRRVHLTLRIGQTCAGANNRFSQQRIKAVTLGDRRSCPRSARRPFEPPLSMR